MKQVRWIALAAALCLLLTAFSIGTVATTAEAVDPVELVLTAGTASGRAGDLLAIPVTFSHADGYGLKEGAVYVQYDANALRPEAPLNEDGEADWELAAGAPFQYAAVQVTETRPGELKIVFVSPSYIMANEGLLIELPFRVIAHQTMDVTVSLRVDKDFTLLHLADRLPVALDNAETVNATLLLSGSGHQLGDVDGDGKVTTTDARLALQYAAKKIDGEGLDLWAADVDTEEGVTTTDARLILQYAAKKIDSFPKKEIPGGETTTAEEPTSSEVLTTEAPKLTTTTSEPTTTTSKPTTTTSKPTTTTSKPTTTTTKAPKPTIVTTRTSQPLEDNSPDPDFDGHRRGSAEMNTDLVSNNDSALEHDLFGQFLLCKEDNEQLPYTISCYVSPTYSTVTALLPSGIDMREMIVRYTVNKGVKVTYCNQEIVSGVTILDLRYKFKVQLTDQSGNVKDVLVKIMQVNSGLPTFTMVTEGKQEITSKTEYMNASYTLFGGDPDTCPYAMDEMITVTGQAKGRGNTSWGEEKKGYTVKFNEKRKLLDMDNSKDWVLVAAHEDYTLLRNVIAHEMSEWASVPYTLKSRPVDLWYNGEYWGVYDLTEKIEIEGSRVDITKYEPGCGAGNTGFILEFDSHVVEGDWNQDKANRYRLALGDGYEVFYNEERDELFFQPNFPGGKWCTIAKPSYTKYLLLDNDQIRYIYDYVQAAANAVANGTFEELSRYIDVESFCNWYIIEELMSNTDSSMHSSVYMTKDAGGKLKMGPVWDFDRSSGGNTWTAAQSVATADRDINSLLYSHREAWFYYSIYKHPEGRAVLKTQWEKFYQNSKNLGAEMDKWYAITAKGADWNFQKWHILGAENNGTRNRRVGDATEEELNTVTYKGQVENLKNFLLKRREAMNTYITKTLPNEGY